MFSSSRLRKGSTLLLILGLGILCIPVKADETVQEKTYLFGIVPQQSASRLVKMWFPFINQLSLETGLKISFATTKDIPTFEVCLADGAFEFSYMNPYHYTVFNELSGYQAFAHQADKKLKGVIVSKKDSSYNTLEDLDGKNIAFPSPAAFGASVLPQAEMRQKGIRFNPHYVKSHDSVYRSVAGGFHPAGGGVGRTFNATASDVKEDLRIIYKTKGYTPHAFATAPHVPAEHVLKVQNTMMKIAKENPELVKAIGMSGFKKAQNTDWDDVRALNLKNDVTGIIREGQIVCRLN
ncbi:MAG: phosphate/phosphite/phosphonate ABC transporter substrate-binding protein [Methylocystaceae bacterium]|nr:phosphate/phosphite/phosphonate ABC transporter substrate-binding protein [Methylocystaceae bacterium]